MKKIAILTCLAYSTLAMGNWHYRVANGLPVGIMVETTRKGALVQGEPPFRIPANEVGPDRNYTEKNPDKNAVTIKITSPAAVVTDEEALLKNIPANPEGLIGTINGPEFDAIIHAIIKDDSYALEIQRVNISNDEQDTWR